MHNIADLPGYQKIREMIREARTFGHPGSDPGAASVPMVRRDSGGRDQNVCQAGLLS
jgi:hypothetical protein